MVSARDLVALIGSLRSPQGSPRSRRGSLRSPRGNRVAEFFFQCNDFVLDAFFSDADGKTMKSGLKNIVTALKKIAINRLLYKSYEKKGNKISLQILVLDLKSEVWQFVFFDPMRQP